MKSENARFAGMNFLDVSKTGYSTGKSEKFMVYKIKNKTLH